MRNVLQDIEVDASRKELKSVHELLILLVNYYNHVVL